MFELLLGHLAGDYLLQNGWMALNKSKNTLKGWFAATVHCILYTFAVCLFMWNFELIWIVVVFFSHFFIDKFSLAEYYSHYIKGGGLKKYVSKDDWIKNIQFLKLERYYINRFDVLDGGFATLVYTVTDNTMHLILMWGAYQIIY